MTPEFASFTSQRTRACNPKSQHKLPLEQLKKPKNCTCRHRLCKLLTQSEMRIDVRCECMGLPSKHVGVQGGGRITQYLTNFLRPSEVRHEAQPQQFLQGKSNTTWKQEREYQDILHFSWKFPGPSWLVWGVIFLRIISLSFTFFAQDKKIERGENILFSITQMQE